MNKSIALSKLEEPPLFMLFIATISLVINICFPQYSAMADSRKQEFERENSLSQSITLNSIKEEIEKTKNAKQKINNQEVENFAELVLEKSVTKHAKVVTVTAYSSTVDQCDSSPFITASGSRVRDGIIATNALSFGTKVKFPSVFGDKVFVVEDRMNARYSDRADIWFETREEAKQFGVKRLEMVIVS
jgi:3D (Asp-Asp-Asp) domain-containing protein